MLVEGRDHSFLKRLAQSIIVAFAPTLSPIQQHPNIQRQQVSTTNNRNLTSEFCECNKQNNEQTITSPTATSIAKIPKSFIEKSSFNYIHHHICHYVICKLWNIVPLFIVIIILLTNHVQSNHYPQHDHHHHHLLIIVTYLLLNICCSSYLRTLLSFVRYCWLLLNIEYIGGHHLHLPIVCCSSESSATLLNTQLSLTKTTKTKSQPNRTLSTDYSSHHYKQPKQNLISLSLILFAMVSLAISTISASADPHSKYYSTSNNQRHSTDDVIRLHPDDIKQVMQILGLGDKPPKPAPHHKVPDYIFDLYRWFRQNEYIHQLDNEQNDPDPDPGPEQFKLANSELASLTTDDLSVLDQIRRINNDDDIHHHRLIRKRRSAQSSRVTLQGPSSTVIAHKSSLDRQFERSLKSKSSSSSSDAAAKTITLSPNNAHLTFDFHLPGAEILTGAELRLYRHSLYNVEGNGASSMSSTHHSSIDNSHPSNVNVDFSGEEYSKQQQQHHGPHKTRPGHYLQRVNIFHLLRPLPMNNTNHYISDHRIFKSAKLVDTQVIDVRDSGWLSFDVFPAVDWWLKHPNENYGLLVNLMDYRGLNESPYGRLFVFNPESSLVQSNNRQSTSQMDGLFHDHPWHEVQPLIITFSNDVRQQKHHLVNYDKVLNRSKRERKRSFISGLEPGQQQKPRNKKRNHKISSRRRRMCGRYQMYFDFKDVDWSDWIVAPPGFQSYYCKGECSYPMSQQVNKTNHAIIQSLINSVNPAVVPEPCCTPTELSSITLLYLDHDKVVLKSYPDMVVEGCGCT